MDYIIEYQDVNCTFRGLTGMLVIYLSQPQRVKCVRSTFYRGSISFALHYQGASPI